MPTHCRIDNRNSPRPGSAADTARTVSLLREYHNTGDEVHEGHVFVVFPRSFAFSGVPVLASLTLQGDTPAMPTEELKHSTEHYLMPTYTRQPISIVRGRGTKVYDLEGREYVDFVAGIAVNVLGHGHPDLVLAIQKQAAQLIHTSNLYYTEPQVRLAEMLVDHSFADQVFFANSGAEANEAAIKLARRYSHDKYGAGRFEIITMKQSFHGRPLLIRLPSHLYGLMPTIR